MRKKSIFEEVLIQVMSCIIDNFDMFDVNLPPIEIYKSTADDIIINEGLE